MICNIVIDTGYLVELFKVPKHSNETNATEIENRFKLANDNKSRLIPIPVLFELGNHIAYVDDGNQRYRLTNQFVETIRIALEPSTAFLNIIPCEAFAVAKELSDSLMNFCNFAEMYMQQGLSLTDSAVALEARNLKTSINTVHIWTLDKALKALEPDTEPEPFIG